MTLPQTSVAGLPTTSAKIRALAADGMPRADIARYLGIRYQHVRNVLVVDADKSKPLRPAVLQQVTCAAALDKPSEGLPALLEHSDQRLLNGGFHILGAWQHCERLGIKLSVRAPDCPGVYAFVVDGIIRYIGVTQRGIRARLDGYTRGHVGQRTNARVKERLLASLAAGQRVEILIAAPPDGEWNGLPVNGVAGLEYGLIRELKPMWNMLGVGK